MDRLHCHFQPMNIPFLFTLFILPHYLSQTWNLLTQKSFDFLPVRLKKMELVLWIKTIFWLSESYKIVWKLSNKRRIDAWQEWDKVPCFWENLCFVSLDSWHSLTWALDTEMYIADKYHGTIGGSGQWWPVAYLDSLMLIIEWTLSRPVIGQLSYVMFLIKW